MNGGKLDGASLQTLAQLATLRMLVESIISAMPLGMQHDTSVCFAAQCEQCMAGLLGGTSRDALPEAMQAAIALQWQRLAPFGMVPPAAPPGHSDQECQHRSGV